MGIFIGLISGLAIGCLLIGIVVKAIRRLLLSFSAGDMLDTIETEMNPTFPDATVAKYDEHDAVKAE